MNASNLDVWKKSMTLAEDVYTATRDFPVEERFGLTSQIRRAATSISINMLAGLYHSFERS